MFFGVRGKTQVLLQHQPPWRHQETTFKVGCTDLSGGLPISEYSYRLFLHNYVHPHDIRTIMASFGVVHVSLELSLCCINRLSFFFILCRTQIYDKDTSKFIASVVMIQGK